MKQLILFFALILSSTLMLNAQTSSNPDTEKLVEDFFKTYKRKGQAEAVSELMGTNKWLALSSAEKISDKLIEVTNQLGEYQGYERIKETVYGTNVIQYVYLVKYDRQPLRFTFRFYRPDKKWQAQNFDFESEFLDELNNPPKLEKL